jgi:hypothetical protein
MTRKCRVLFDKSVGVLHWMSTSNSDDLSRLER